MLTQRQAERRDAGLGGSDVAAILGLNPFKSALEVWAEKTGRKGTVDERQADFEGNEAVEWGNRLEAVVAAKYAEGLDADEDLTFPKDWDQEDFGGDLIDGTFVDPSEPWRITTPDGLVLRYFSRTPEGGKRYKPVRGLEVKTTGYRKWHEWGDPEKIEVPTPALVQAVWNMSHPSIDVPRWDVAVLIGGQAYRVYEVPRNHELEERILSAARSFWRHNVEGGSPPEPDGSDSAKRVLGELYPKAREPLAKTTPDLDNLARAYRDADRAKADAEGKAQALQNQLKAKIGNGEGFMGEWGHITWKNTKRGRRFQARFKE